MPSEYRMGPVVARWRVTRFFFDPIRSDISVFQNYDVGKIINEKGCVQAGEEWIEHNLLIVAGIAVATAFLQVTFFFFSSPYKSCCYHSFYDTFEKGNWNLSDIRHLFRSKSSSGHFRSKGEVALTIKDSHRRLVDAVTSRRRFSKRKTLSSRGWCDGTIARWLRRLLMRLYENHRSDFSFSSATIHCANESVFFRRWESFGFQFDRGTRHQQ